MHVATMIKLPPQHLRSNQPWWPWWCWTKRHMMMLHNGKHDACQILKIPFEDQKDLICEKTKWNISFWNKKSWWNRQTKNSNKNVLKTYFFYFQKCATMLQLTKEPSLINIRRWEEEWQQKKNFLVSSGHFSMQKMTKENIQNVAIKLTFGPQKMSAAS